MNDKRDFDRSTAEWLNEGSDVTPPEVINAVLLAAKSTPQERDFRIPWRTPSMTMYLRVAAVIAIVAVAGVAAFYASGSGPNIGSGPSPSPTVQQSPTASPTADLEGPIDTTRWTTFESDRYGFTIGHPADWTAFPADHDWTLAEDAANYLSTGQEVFRPPSDNVRVSAWSVALDPGTIVDELPSEVEAWIEGEYCQFADSVPCTGIGDRAVALCVEARDCHPGLLVPFDRDVLAFFTGGAYAGQMVVVAVWWEESAPAVAEYGGSQRLLEGFLATMGVCTAGEGFSSRGAGCQ